MATVDAQIIENARLSATAIGRAEGRINERERIVQDLLTDPIVLSELGIYYLDRIICIIENRLKEEPTWVR